MAVRLSIRLRVLVFLPESRTAGRSHNAPCDQGAIPLACSKLRYLMPEVGGVRFFEAASICCCTPYSSVYACLYACLHCRGPVMQVGRTTPGRPGGDFSAGCKWRALTPEVRRLKFPNAARVYGCMPYASVFVCLYSCLSPTMQVSRTTPGRPGGEFPSRRQVASFHARGRA